MNDFKDLFRRDGHLSDLTLDRLSLNDMSAGEAGAARQHLEGCDPCDFRFAAVMESQDASLPPMPDFAALGAKAPEPAPSQAVAPVVDLAAARRRRRWVAGGGAALAIAAALFLVFRPAVPTERPGGDGIRLRGGGAISLQVFRDDGRGGELLHSGDRVAAGDRIGFRYRARSAGFLVIVGRDSGGSAYPCFPQQLSAGAVSVSDNEAWQRVDSAVRFDDKPGAERIVAVLCQAPFNAADASAWLSSEPPEGCSFDDITLEKAPTDR